MKTTALPGKPLPLGAIWDGEGVNFSFYAEHASGVELCLFDPSQPIEKERITMGKCPEGIWHIYAPGVSPGQLYGYRAYGDYNVHAGHRYNPAKLLLDPYARAITGNIKWNEALLGYKPGADDTVPSDTDSAPFMPRSVVIDGSFSWEGDKLLQTPFEETVIYELHVKGFTQLHPQLPEEIRGKYAALGHPVITGYLKELGVTAVELMPVHHSFTDNSLLEKGLSNYWGYDTIGFFAPDARFSAAGTNGEQVREFKEMVKQLHKAGIEVLLDVVYNHSAEGNHMGPTLCFRGADNLAYYRLMGNDCRYYHDLTGTGCSLNVSNPNVMRMIMDSLRYWVTEMHVDGFRFDLAASLVRQFMDAERLNAFFDIIHQDPVLSRVKLIAEPWDITETGYLLGKFPPKWAEWNDKFRDGVRKLWNKQEISFREFTTMFSSMESQSLETTQQPFLSINYITAHDGFTLQDLVSYNQKHNEANGNDNKDGMDENHSNNWGAEGETEDQQIVEQRKKIKRSLLATLLFSLGVPMIVAGDELGKTQQGNNNPFCQDNELSWIHWDQADEELLRFVKQLVAIRKKHPIFCRKRWPVLYSLPGTGVDKINWVYPDGNSIREEEMAQFQSKAFGVLLNGFAGDAEKWIYGECFFLVFNVGNEEVEFTLPATEHGLQWTKMIDTAEPGDAGCSKGMDKVKALPYSMQLFRKE